MQEICVDAFGEDVNIELGAEHKVKLESRLKFLEQGSLRKLSGTGKAKAKFEKYQGKSEIVTYESAYDNTLPSSSKKRKHSESAGETPKKTLIEEIKTEVKEEEEEGAEAQEVPKKKKKKKKVTEEEEESPAAKR
uniref:Nop domain-containing protein n=1 Tax=Phlebotomus papatasi TaxID=29031 RepID=A0A1B0DDF4_PHLPP